MLKTNPDALEAFEKAYKAVEDTDHDEDTLFAMNSRQAVSESRKEHFLEHIDEEQLNKLINSIVDELIEIPKGNYLTDGKTLITNEDIKAVPESLRPQLTGTLCKVDINEPAYISLLEFYKKAVIEKNPKRAKDTNRNLCIQNYDDFKILHDECIENIKVTYKQQNRTIPRSFGIAA